MTKISEKHPPQEAKTCKEDPSEQKKPENYVKSTLLDAKAAGTRAAYERYVKRYINFLGLRPHSEDGLTEFLADLHKTGRFKGTTLMTILSHIKSFLLLELNLDFEKIPRTQAFIKAVSNILNDLFVIYFYVEISLIYNYKMKLPLKHLRSRAKRYSHMWKGIQMKDNICPERCVHCLPSSAQ